MLAGYVAAIVIAAGDIIGGAKDMQLLSTIGLSLSIVVLSTLGGWAVMGVTKGEGQKDETQ